MMGFLIASLLMAESPAAIIEAGHNAWAELTVGQKIFVKACAKPKPLPELVGIVGGNDTYTLKCDFEVGMCGIVNFTDSTGILDVYAVLVDRTSIQEGVIEICRFERCVIRGQSILDSLAQDRKLKRITFVAAVIDEAGPVLEHIDVENANVAAVLRAQKIERSRHVFQSVGPCFYSGIERGKYAALASDGSPILIEPGKLRPEELKWIKQYRADELSYRQCLAMLRLTDRRDRASARNAILMAGKK